MLKRRPCMTSSVRGRLVLAGIAAVFSTASPLAAAGPGVAGKGPVAPTKVTRPALAGVSVPVRSITITPVTPDPKVELEIPFRPPVKKSNTPLFLSSPKGPDGALMARTNAPNAMPAAVANFQGVGQSGQGAVSGFYVSPPDTVGDVGPNHYVQCVNLACQIFGKTGTPAGGAFTIKAMFASLGGECAATNDGDPIVLYDPIADRWLLSQFAVANRPPAHECVAISQTADPTGAYYLYDFVIPNNYFNDYPKLGVWPDGYYMTSPLFEGPVFGQGAYILNRTKMLAGDPAAEMVFFDLTTAFPGLQRILPADLDGPPPAPGTPNYMATIAADEFGDAQDGIRLFEVKADWQNLAASTFTEVPFPSGVLPVAAFDPTLTQTSGNCGFAFTVRDDIEQPAPGNCGMRLDALSDRPMHRLAYRTQGGNESLVFNHTVDANATPATATSGHLAGIRYYELRRALPSGTWAVAEQATYAPDTTHRWMGSAAMDGQGNIAVGYSVSDGTTTFPGVRYAGRLAGDPANGLFQGEAVLAAGGRSQTSTGSRWGDYSAMSVDPVDECTFWYTQEYYDATAPGTCSTTTCWQTRIGSFKFPGCSVTSSTGTLTGTVTDSATAAAISGAIVSANGYTATTNGSGVYSMVVPAATYAATASKAGYADVSVAGLTVAAAGTTTQNFALGSGAIAGTVTNSVSAAALSGAQVTITGGVVRTTSATGTYSASVAPGTYTAVASATGYFSSTQSGLVVGTSGTVAANFALQPAPALTTATTVDDTLQGNGNLVPDPNECAWLFITVTNAGTTPITTVSGTVATSTTGVTVIAGTSAYPDIAAAGSGVNASPFRIQTSPSFVAGTPILVVLSLTTNLGVVELPVTVQTYGGTPSSFPATGPVAIPDNNAAGAALNVPVSGFTSTLAHVAVRVRITHTFDGDLVLKLAGPDGTTVLLAYQAGAAGAGFGTDCPASANDTTFDDAATTSILAGAAPFAGSFVPQQALVAFAGKSGAQVNGTWKLQAIDLGAADTGNIECVELVLTGATTGPGGTCNVPVELLKIEVE